MTDENGQKRYLNPNNPADRERYSAFIRNSARAGATGIGHGPGYMGGDGIHVGGGTPAVWGRDKTRRTASPWVVDFYEKGRRDLAQNGLPDFKRGSAAASSAIFKKPGAGGVGAGGIRDGYSRLDNIGANPSVGHDGIREHLALVNETISAYGRLGKMDRNAGGGGRTGKVKAAMRGAFSSQGMG